LRSVPPINPNLPAPGNANNPSLVPNSTLPQVTVTPGINNSSPQN
jgi:hypothetical protein